MQLEMKLQATQPTPIYIRTIRQEMGLGRTEFANMLGMGSAGERTVRGWEKGEHVPTKKKLDEIGLLIERLEEIKKRAPYGNQISKRSKFTFIDLFAGIGGIRLPFQELGGKCVFTSEWDKFAQKTYLTNFGEMPHGDITEFPTEEIPAHDVLLAGFPCQAFSQAGLKKGFNDTRGTMFFEIQKILVEHRPKAFLLENVKQLRGHDKGRTLATILSILRGKNKQGIPKGIEISKETRRALSQKLNYWVDFRVLRAADFGVPQNRERVFIVGFDKDCYGEDADFDKIFQWPIPPKTTTKVSDILLSPRELTGLDDRFTISDRLWAGHKKRKEAHKNKGNGFGYSLFNANSEYTNTISARYYKDGSEILIDQSELNKNPRKLTPRECANLQGFPDEFIVDAVSQGQIYKQFGNSVCMSVIRPVAKSIRTAMIRAEKQKKNKLEAAEEEFA